MQIRLNKYISESGVASRRKSEELILQGRVSVNDKITRDLTFRVEPEKDIVEVDGEKISPRKHLYFLLNKPKGYITSTSDEKRRKTVIELIKTGEKIFPVGRLDYNTTGVLLLTNDGEFANILTHPKHRVPREYEVWLDDALSEEDSEKLTKGLFIDGKRGKFISLKFPGKRNRKFVLVKVEEGRNHFVKNMFRVIGYNVVNLNRKSYAGLEADITVGKYRNLSQNEIKKVYEIYG